MENHRLALKPGYQIEHFRIESVLGKGGFGITYVALDLQLGKRVAIKELLPDSIATRVDGSTVVPHSASLQENWEWARERFLDEARVLAGFSHPAIVGVHRLIEANGTVYMVMDFVDGESYEARLRRIGREPNETSLMGVIGPILQGLHEVHTQGLLHRDIKPENILINHRGQPVLIDFGSARLSVGATMTMTSIVTHGYSPIEQYQTKGKMGPWTDIYALGAVMCRAITGEKPPVASDRLMQDEFVWLRSRQVAGFSEHFLQTVDCSLRVRPEERPPTLASWNLNALPSQDEAPSKGQGVSSRMDRSGDSFPPKVVIGTEEIKSPGRWYAFRDRILPAVGLTALVVIIASVAFGLLAHRNSVEQPENRSGAAASATPFNQSGTSSTPTESGAGSEPNTPFRENNDSPGGQGSLAKIVRLERSDSDRLNIVYREAPDYPKSRQIEIWIEDPNEPSNRFKLAVFDRNASVFISPDDEWIALNVYPTSSGGGSAALSAD